MQMKVMKGRLSLAESLTTAKARRDLSPVFLAQYENVVPMLEQYAKGSCVDIGCGTSPFWEHLEKLVDIYHGVDRYPQSRLPVVVGDVQKMSMFKDDSYDTALCFEVLEHVANPDTAIDEIRRIMKAGGHLILTVPHLSRLHEVPHDYYRYTSFGIQYLLEKNGFEIVTISEKGGLLCFLGHQLSTVFVSLLWQFPFFQRAALLINRYLLVMPCYYLDRVLPTTPLFALGYIVVAKKLGR